MYTHSATITPGSLNQNREPLPSSESTPIRPPSCSMILWQIESPNPVPGTKELSLTKTFKDMATAVPYQYLFPYLHIEYQFFPLHLIAHTDTSLRSKLNRIVYKVRDYLMQTITVANEMVIAED